MWRLVKVGLALSVLVAGAYLLSRLADDLAERPILILPVREKTPPVDPIESDPLEEPRVVEVEEASLDDAWTAFVEEFDSEKKVVLLKDMMGEWPLEKVVAFFGDALSLGLADGEIRLAAGVAMERMASLDPVAAVAAFSALLPIDKESLAFSVAEGWTQTDPLSAWDWIESAWMDVDGAVFDRPLQRELLSTAMSAVLEEHRDLPLAATLTSLTPDQDLKSRLAAQIAAFVVSNEPEEMLQAFEFEGDKTVDQAIMDEIVREWSGRDAQGVIEWVSDNAGEVSSVGAEYMAKQLVAQNLEGELQGVFASLPEVSQRDALAAEAARMLARRDPLVSSNWLRGIGDQEERERTFWKALHEIGDEDISTVVDYLAMSFPESDLRRFGLAERIFSEWNVQDPDVVRDYLNATEVLTPQERTGLKALLE